MNDNPDILMLLSRHLQGKTDVNEAIRQHCREMIALVSDHLETAGCVIENVADGIDKRVVETRDVAKDEKELETLLHLQQSLSNDGIFAHALLEIVQNRDDTWSTDQHPDRYLEIGAIIVEAYQRLAENSNPSSNIPLLLQVERLTLPLLACCDRFVMTEKVARQKVVHRLVQRRGKKGQEQRNTDMIRDTLEKMLIDNILSKGTREAAMTNEWLASRILERLPVDDKKTDPSAIGEKKKVISLGAVKSRLKQWRIGAEDLCPGNEEAMLLKIK